jgi:hypothetical protein
MIPFHQIDFGLASAELEGASKPELLLKGYLDKDQIETSLIDGHKFLVLGHKGSGKSAIAEKIRLTAQTKHDYFVKKLHLGDFPFKSFGKIMPGKAEPESKYPTTWSWILLLLLVDSLAQDCSVNSDPCYSQTLRVLREIGLLPADDLKQLVMKSSKKAFRAHIPQLIDVASEATTKPAELDLQLVYLVDQIKACLKRLNCDNTHLLILDGLDDILTDRQIRFQSISALIFEANRLNLFFLQNKVTCKIIVLCRTDLFEKLPAPNKNKLRQDSAFELDWYHDPRDSISCHLLSLINLRASLSAGKDVNVFKEYLPPVINNKASEVFLLNNTRHTPRDFIQLMNHIKQYTKDIIPLRRTQIMSGIADYSKKYFLPEIRDEMVGYVDDRVFDRFLDVLGSFREREMSYRRLSEVCRDRAGISEEVLRDILTDLFNCSAIGNKFQKAHRDSPRYFFKYRNQNDTISFDDTFVIHTGMWKALNVT